MKIQLTFTKKLLCMLMLTISVQSHAFIGDFFINRWNSFKSGWIAPITLGVTALAALVGYGYWHYSTKTKNHKSGENSSNNSPAASTAGSPANTGQVSLAAPVAAAMATETSSTNNQSPEVQPTLLTLLQQSNAQQTPIASVVVPSSPASAGAPARASATIIMLSSPVGIGKTQALSAVEKQHVYDDLSSLLDACTFTYCFNKNKNCVHNFEMVCQWQKFLNDEQLKYPLRRNAIFNTTCPKHRTKITEKDVARAYVTIVREAISMNCGQRHTEDEVADLIQNKIPIKCPHIKDTSTSTNNRRVTKK